MSEMEKEKGCTLQWRQNKGYMSNNFSAGKGNHGPYGNTGEERSAEKSDADGGITSGRDGESSVEPTIVFMSYDE
ncbi:predicted protein [Sclerotinia sclerotiorum 1980 UF-70]|uniref:Uncharacterized protein n=1 Tax=Sclerotinia sclerotiorum (strain ATCC 18683 / 1980 / Ss-1) TaxID=665079 RepID=A7EF93_SCLS1|nr:predicted protein [Sclerotinia sclerotiorum 1980 UF-70]EDO01509.1 predicted protein [Sclerotinia sclerotiorum 1980 UF-70]